MPSDAEGFSAEIARMKVIGAQHNDVAVRAKAHLQLARLYSDYRNPEPNYFNALQELETHIDLDPGGRGNDEIQNWLAMLRELARYESESRRKERNIETLKKENKAAKDHVDQLEKKNREMKDLIDKLQSIDIQIEERRRSIK